ncbi:MAG: SCO1664 family protein, partial [Anaerolineales bacterium]
LINNADRKGSHILIDPDHHIWLIDHGICFHVESKLRTVVWDFAGEPIPSDLCADLTVIAAPIPGRRCDE